MVTETWQAQTVQTILFRHSHCLRGQKQKDIDFYIWAKNKRVAKEVDGWKEGEGEREEERDLKGDLSIELPKHLAAAGVCKVGLMSYTNPTRFLKRKNKEMAGKI